MKKLFNTFMVLLAMSLMVTAFVSCKNDSDDDNDDDNVVARYYRADDELEDGGETIIFRTDNTFIVHGNGKKSVRGFTIYVDLDEVYGTYSGNALSDGTITGVEIKKADVDEDDITSKTQAAVLSGKSSVTFTNSDFPLENVPESERETFSGVISGSTLTLKGDVYTRQ